MQPLDEFKILFCQILFGLGIFHASSYYNLVDSEQNEEPQKKYRANLQELRAYICGRYNLTPEQVYELYTQMIDEMLGLYVAEVLSPNPKIELSGEEVQKIINDTLSQQPRIDPNLH